MNIHSAEDSGKRAIHMKEVAFCSTAQQRRVLEIRNSESVRGAMYMDHIIGEDEHMRWIKTVSCDQRQRVFVILNEKQEPLGVVSLNAIDLRHKKADWAFYLDLSARGGLGTTLEYRFIDYAFDCCGLEKLNCEVLETNARVVEMHKSFSFVEEGFRRENIVKNDKRIGVFFLGLTRADWLRDREAIFMKNEAKINRFELSFVKG